MRKPLFFLSQRWKDDLMGSDMWKRYTAHLLYLYVTCYLIQKSNSFRRKPWLRHKGIAITLKTWHIVSVWWYPNQQKIQNKRCHSIKKAYAIHFTHFNLKQKKWILDFFYEFFFCSSGFRMEHCLLFFMKKLWFWFSDKNEKRLYTK